MNTQIKARPGSWRDDFPIFRNSPVVFLDSAASAQKPEAVLDAVRDFFSLEYANIHRGVYELAEKATERFEGVRRRIVRQLNAASEREIVFTHGTTEGINLVAHSFGGKFIRPGDEIIVSLLEHHSNFVPWQLLAERSGAVVRYAGVTPEGEFDLDQYRSLLSEKTRLVAVTQLSNALGIAPPLPEIISLAKKAGAKVLVDGAQGICHLRTDVQELGADFYVYSSHKLYGPTGIGVLWGREELLEEMPPFLSGGDMIRSVSVAGTEFNDLPYKFEAGTPHIAGVVGLGAALEYLDGLGWENIFSHEEELVRRLESMLEGIPEVRVLGPQGRHIGLVTFTVDGIHPHDVAQALDEKGLALRAGHHCAQPLLEQLGIPASMRASVGLYNTAADIDALEAGLRHAVSFFSRKGGR